MARRLIDISVALEAGIRSDPPGLEPEITYRDHRETLGQLLPFFPASKRATCRTARPGRSSGWRSPPTTAPISTRPGTMPRR